MILYPQETVIVQGAATLLAGARVTPGTLSVTTHRLVFEAGGIAPFTVIDVGVERVWNVHIGRQPGRFLTPSREFLTVETHYGRSLFEVVNGRGWADAIVRARSSLPPPPAPPPPPESPRVPGPPVAGNPAAPVVIHVAAPPAPKVMLPCRYCGGLYDAASGRCDRCGARP